MRAGAALLVLLATMCAACSFGDDGVEPVATSSCGRLLYDGEGEPDVIVVSDFPLRGIGATMTKRMVDAIEFVLRKRDFRAGDLRVGYQSCNDTIGDEPYDEPLCRRNAQAYVDAKDVVGIVGPWNSGCAGVQIPVVSRQAAGPLAMISPSNTYHGLTRTEAARSLYPDGVRNYVRVVTHDHAQGTAAAHLARRLGARRAAVVHQDFREEYVRELAVSFAAVARTLGLETSRFEWPLRKSYTDLAASVTASRPDVVYLAGLTPVNAKRLVEDLRAVLPRDVELVAPDSFAASDIAQELGPAGEGMLVTVPGIPVEALPPAGRRFLREFGPVPSESGGPSAVEAAQATEVLLDAIARSDGTRASVVEELFATKVENGILGSFSFDRNGDIVPRLVGIYRFEGGKIVGDSVVRTPLSRS